MALGEVVDFKPRKIKDPGYLFQRDRLAVAMAVAGMVVKRLGHGTWAHPPEDREEQERYIIDAARHLMSDPVDG